MWSERSLSSKGPLPVPHLPLALHCWPHRSPSGKLTSPADQWLITPGAQDRPGTKFPHCHAAYIKLFCLPPRSHHIWQSTRNPRCGEALTRLKLKRVHWAEGWAGRQPLSAGPGRRSRLSGRLFGIWGCLHVGIEMKQTSNCAFEAGTSPSHGAFIADFPWRQGSTPKGFQNLVKFK